MPFIAIAAVDGKSTRWQARYLEVKVVVAALVTITTDVWESQIGYALAIAKIVS